ncbi:MAG: SLC13 family permease, partial [Pseudomonadota bacterium]
AANANPPTVNTPMDPLYVTAFVICLVWIAMVRVNRATDFILWGGVGLLLVAPVKDGNTWSTGVISASDALAGLANEGVITIAALFIVAAGLSETGAMHALVRRFLGQSGSIQAIQNRLLWPTAVLSGFLNNTPLVAMLLPITHDWAKRHQFSVSHLLMPLSFAAILGGACTLIGTSTNLIVNGWLIEETGSGLGMFDIAMAGLPIAVVGIVFVLIFSRWLLPIRKPALQVSDDAREYVVEMVIDESSALIGQSVEDAGLRGLNGLFLIEIERDGEILAAVSASIRLQANDRLVFAGVIDSVVELQRFEGLRPATNQIFKLNESRHNRIMVEAVVSNTCPLVGQTIKEGQFRTIYNAAVIAVARNGERLNRKIGEIRLKAGDTLLIEARRNFVEQQRNRRDFYLISKIDDFQHPNAQLAPVAIGILIGIVIAATSGVLSMLQASLAGALLIVASGCCGASVARRAIDWEVLLVIAAALALGKAMENSGLANALANIAISSFGSHPTTLLATIIGMTMVLAALVTAKAAAVLMLPIAFAAAGNADVSIMPYVVGVMLAASTSVATPIGYPTNLMVYGPGGYHFSDYLRLGGPLSIIILLMSIFLIPIFWPF